MVLGLCSGLVVHTHGGGAGLAAVFAASALAFTLLQFVGGLPGLAGSGMLRAPVAAVARLPRQRADGLQRGAWWARRGDEPVEPQGAGVLPGSLPIKFADPARGGVAADHGAGLRQFMLATLLVFAHRLLFGRLGTLPGARLGAQWVLNRLAGLVFPGLAARLATVQRWGGAIL